MIAYSSAPRMVMFVDSFHFCTISTFGIATAVETEISGMETLEPSVNIVN